MYANAIEVPWMTARMAESFGLNSNPTVFVSLFHCLFSHSSKPAFIRFFRTSSGLTYEVSEVALISASLMRSSSLTSGFSLPQFSRQFAFAGSRPACCIRGLKISRSHVRFMKRCSAMTFLSAISRAALADASVKPGVVKLS